MLASNLACFTVMRWARVTKNVLAITVWADCANGAIQLIGGALAFPAFTNVTSLFARDLTRLRSEHCPPLPTLPFMFELMLFLHDNPRSVGG